MTQFWEKALLTDWPTYLLTDGANFIGPFHFRGGPKKEKKYKEPASITG